MTEPTAVRSSALARSEAAGKNSFPVSSKPLASEELLAIELVLLSKNDLARVVALHLAAEGGVRSLELCRIRLDDVDLVNRRVLIRNHKTAPRFAFFSAKSVDSLSRWLEVRSSDCGHQVLLHDRHDQPFTSPTLTRQLAKAAREAGIEGFRLGCLRATLAVRLLHHGLNVEIVGAIGGWTTNSSSKRFFCTSPVDARAAYDEVMLKGRV